MRGFDARRILAARRCDNQARPVSHKRVAVAEETLDERSSRHGQAPVPDRRHRCDRRRRRGVRGRAIPRLLAAERPRERRSVRRSRSTSASSSRARMIKVEWRGKAIYIVHRTPQMLAQLEGHGAAAARPGFDAIRSSLTYAKNPARAIKPEYLVLVGVCTHLGCAPLDRFTPGDVDRLPPTGRAVSSVRATARSSISSGRVFKDVPAPTNLSVPPYRFLSDTPDPDRRRTGERVMEQHAARSVRRRAAAGSAALAAWIDERFPMTALWKEHASEYYAPKNFNFWYYFGSLALFVLVHPDRHRHLPDDELQAVGGRGVQLGRVHHARRRVGLADPLHALDRRLGVLHRRLPAHVPRAPVRVVPASRASCCGSSAC